MHFGHLWALGLLALLPVLIWRALSPGRSPAVRFPTLGALETGHRSWAGTALGILAGLRGASLGLIILALAAPRIPGPPVAVRGAGIGIEMVLDVSSSMNTPDYVLDGHPMSRLDVVKRVFRRFVLGGAGLPGRPGDLIGMVTFANNPDIVCPLTLDRGVLLSQLSATRIARPSDDGTNIGDAIAWATEDLRAAPTRQRVMILLTDGINEPVITAGNRPLDPVAAAQVAAAEGVRIYTIGVGGRPTTQAAGPGLDEALLRRVAALSGGRFFRADDTGSLGRIYAMIDRLEKTPIIQWVASDPRELYPYFAVLALVLVVLEQLLAATRLRRLP